MQSPFELYADFIGRSKSVLEKHIKREQNQEWVLRHLTFDNAGDGCQGITKSQRNLGNIMDFLKLCRNVGS